MLSDRATISGVLNKSLLAPPSSHTHPRENKLKPVSKIFTFSISPPTRPPPGPVTATHTHTPCRIPSSEDDASEVASMTDSLTRSSRGLFRDNSVGQKGCSTRSVLAHGCSALVSDGWTLRCLDRHRYILYCVGRVAQAFVSVRLHWYCRLDRIGHANN